MELAIEKYRIKEKVSVWKFEETRSYGDYGVAFSPEAKLQLIELIRMMKASPWPSKKSIPLVDPLDLNQQWIQKNGKYSPQKNLTLNYRADPPYLLEITESIAGLEIKLGKETFLEFEALIKDGFDSGFGTDEVHIMFW